MDRAQKQKELVAYAESLKSMSLEELKALEQDVIKEADSIDKEIAETKYKLPKKDYENVASAIRMLLEKHSVAWQYTLGLVAMFDFWDPKTTHSTILHPMLDSTLRTLGEGQFTGYSEWAAVVAVNKYFEALREQYITTSEKIYDVAAKHNAIQDQIKLLEPVQTVPDAIQVGE